ncbi:MAG: DUF488 family protein, N3 subclade [Longimicrobiales bacterium]
MAIEHEPSPGRDSDWWSSGCRSGRALGGVPAEVHGGAENAGAWKAILQAARRGNVTLLDSARDSVHNGAVVLRAFLVEHESGRPAR